MLTAAKLLPGAENWQPRRAPKPSQEQATDPTSPSLAEAIWDLSPVERLDAELAGEVRAELEKVRGALQEARQLAHARRGRYDVEWRRDFLSTRMIHLGYSRVVTGLLFLDAAMLAQDGDRERAVRSSLAILNVGRSLGDEPTTISLKVRCIHQTAGAESLERVLGQGQVSSEALSAIEKVLQEEALRPGLLIALRGERAVFTDLLGRVYQGEYCLVDWRGAWKMSSRWDRRLEHWYETRPKARLNQASYLEQMTQAVQAAKSESPARLRDVFRRLQAANKPGTSSDPYRMAKEVAPDFWRLVCIVQQGQARLLSTRVALAAERYRLAQAHWPASLAELVPAFLDEIPNDPFSNQALLCRKLDDGFVVYSVGLDGLDDGGAWHGKVHDSPDIGFRLWDPDKRGQPAKPVPGNDGEKP